MSKRASLSALGEFGFLGKLIPKLYWPPSLRNHLTLGPGDDAGAIRVSRGKVLVASTDALVEDIHFRRRWFPWTDLGHKALAVNLSDLAAMGGVKPLAALITAAFPGDTPVDSVDKFYKGLEQCARRWKIGLLGGDTVGSKGGWFVSVTVLGESSPKHLIKRSTARPGDLLMTSGPLGLAAAGFEVLEQNGSRGAFPSLLSAFCRPQPRFQEAAFLANGSYATSLMDCSDGLEASANILCSASETGIELWLDQLPLHSELRRWSRSQKKEPWQYALFGGEDYQLLWTVRPDDAPRVSRRFPQSAILGKMLPTAAGRYAITGEKRIPLKGYGFAHFQ